MKSYQKGSALVVALSLLAVVVIGVVTVVGMYISAHNYAIAAENGIRYAHRNNQQILGQYSLKVQEAAGVTEVYANDVKDVVTAALEGRYGGDGSKAVMQWIQEQNPSVDSTVYVKVQQIIEAGRTEFQEAQKLLLSRKNAYDNQLDLFLRGTFLRIAGFPKINMDDYDVVVSDHSNKAFETGIDTPVKLR